MQRIILVRYQEIFLKGLNRPVFEGKLISNIKEALKNTGRFKVIKSQSRIYIEPVDDEFEFEEAVELLPRVFGIASISVVIKVDTDFEIIKNKSFEIVDDLVQRKGYKSFKVESKRGLKSFPRTSPEISSDIGAHILKNTNKLRVDVHNPDFVLYIEVRESTYVYSEIIPANGGLPVGCSGRATLLLSGGIDSPVAGWMIAKRGVEIEAVHFHSYPYTSERAKDKVIKLVKILSQYCKKIKLYIVPFTEIQLELNQKCPQDHLTIIMRRIMMKIAEAISVKDNSKALITGESIGQVASQTMEAIYVTDASVNMPVFRPLIGMDKNEVIEIAKKIGTFETSILPYEDCCTVFVAKHPRTKPKMKEVLSYEAVLDIDKMVEDAIKNVEILNI